MFGKNGEEWERALAMASRRMKPSHASPFDPPTAISKGRGFNDLDKDRANLSDREMKDRVYFKAGWYRGGGFVNKDNIIFFAPYRSDIWYLDNKSLPHIEIKSVVGRDVYTHHSVRSIYRFVAHMIVKVIQQPSKYHLYRPDLGVHSPTIHWDTDEGFVAIGYDGRHKSIDMVDFIYDRLEMCNEESTPIHNAYDRDYKRGGIPHGSLDITPTYKDNTMITSNKDNKRMANIEFIGSDYSILLTNEGEEFMSEAYKVDNTIASTLMVGDIAVVEVYGGYKLVTVATVLPNTLENAEDAAHAKAWVVNKLDRTQHLERVEATERHAWVIKQLEEKKKAMDSFQVYAMLANFDGEAAKLIEELKELSGVKGTPPSQDDASAQDDDVIDAVQAGMPHQS